MSGFLEIVMSLFFLSLYFKLAYIMVSVYNAKPSYIVFIEHPEDQRCKLCRVSVWEELRVDLDESLLCEETIGAVLQETLVPLFDLLLSDCRKR